MLDGDDGGGLVHHAHDYAAVDVAATVGIQYVHQARGGTARVGYAAALAQVDFRHCRTKGMYFAEYIHVKVLLPVWRLLFSGFWWPCSFSWIGNDAVCIL